MLSTLHTDKELAAIRAQMEQEDRQEAIRRRRRHVLGLRAWRYNAGWSQRDLSARSLVGRSTIKDIETGKIHPTPATCKRLADALMVEVADIREFRTSAGEPA